MLLIGADPELFIRQGSLVLPAVDLVPGTKRHPHPTPVGAIQVDGTALEFNIHPSSSENEFINNLVGTMQSLREYLNDTAPEGEFFFTPIVQFDKGIFDQLPSTAKELGCDPDFSAYTGKPNPRPEPPETVRTASGHLHIGFCTGANVWSDEHFEACCRLTRHLDATVGYPAQFFSPLNSRRQQFYGNFGSFRPKSYGLEYRVLDNSWLRHTELMKWVYRQTRWAVELWQKGEYAPEWDNMPHDPLEMVFRLQQSGAPEFPLLIAQQVRNDILEEAKHVEEARA